MAEGRYDGATAAARAISVRLLELQTARWKAVPGGLLALDRQGRAFATLLFEDDLGDEPQARDTGADGSRAAPGSATPGAAPRPTPGRAGRSEGRAGGRLSGGRSVGTPEASGGA